MKHTLGTAAKAAGVSKSTIYRAVKSGKLSASRNADDEYEIDPAELHRVYEPVSKHVGNGDMERDATPDETGGDSMALWFRGQLEAAQQKLEQKSVELSDTTAELQDTKERLSEHREAARMLEDKSREWEQTLAERQAEIKAARNEAAELSERLKREAAERAKAEAMAKALESRGVIARLLNRKPATQI